MRLPKRLLALVTILAVSRGASAQCLQPRGGETATSLALSTAQPQVPAGSPVPVDLTATNKSEQDVSMWFEHAADLGGATFSVDVRDSQGKRPVATKVGFYRNGGFRVGELDDRDIQMRYLNFSGACGTFRAGVSFTSRIDAGRLYDLTEPGSYTVVVGYTDPVSGLEVTSNPVSVTVLPPAVPAKAASASVPPRAPFSLTIDHVFYKAPSPVWVHVVTQNTSKRRILLRHEEHPEDTSMLGSTFRAGVRDAKGAPPPDTDLGRAARDREETAPDPDFMTRARAAGDLVSIGPGEDWWDTIKLDNLYDLHQPGQYTIQVRRWDDETKTWVKSNTVTVTVTP